MQVAARLPVRCQRQVRTLAVADAAAQTAAQKRWESQVRGYKGYGLLRSLLVRRAAAESAAALPHGVALSRHSLLCWHRISAVQQLCASSCVRTGLYAACSPPTHPACQCVQGAQVGRHVGYNAHIASHSLLALTVLGGAVLTVQVRDGKVANVTAKKAGEMLKEGWVLLDVRPQEEIAKASWLWLPAAHLVAADCLPRRVDCVRSQFAVRLVVADHRPGGNASMCARASQCWLQWRCRACMCWLHLCAP